MLKILSFMMVAIVAVGLGAECRHHPKIPPTEQFLRAQAVQIHNDKASCSGEIVQAPSGKKFILTAGHCRPLLTMEGVHVTDAEGRSYKARFVAEDGNADLLLLAAIPNHEGLKIAKVTKGQDHVRTFTHGAGYKTYKTEGEIIQTVKIDVPLFAIESDDDRARCSMKKNRIESADTLFGPLTVCMLSTRQTVASASIVPGSSGGMLVNDAGELVGVVSAGNASMPLFGYFVRLSDIQRFLHRF